jgi:YD repeat-containing protein
VDPNGDTHQRVYDGAGRVIREVNPLGNETAYSYDAAGRLSTITDAALNATTTFERDEAGRVTHVIDPLGHETVTSYKLGGRIESTTNARGYSTSFNRTPQSASITDALSRTTTTHLSPYGLATGTTFSDTSSTSSSYAGTTRLDNSQSFPLSFTDESGRSRQYGYDSHSGLQQAADLAGADWSYTYAPTIGSDISYDVESGGVSLNAADAYGFGEGGGSNAF